MSTKRRLPASLAVLAVACTLGAAAPSEGSPVPGAPSCPMTPPDSFWHADVSALPVHPQSSTYVQSVGPTAGLKADFGSGLWDGGPIGIPYTTVPGTQPRVPVSFYYPDESDPGPYPIPPDAPIEGGPNSTGDRHVLIVDRDACRLWELYDAYPNGGGTSWDAGSGATWDLNSNAMRSLGWTSADAAGLPLLPGLVRYDEIASGEIDHAIRFTAPRTANTYVWPASHKAATGGSSDPPMGTWFRLKATYDISGFSAANQVILHALKKHGMVLADNGSSWFMSGAPDERFDNDDLHQLGTVPGSAFEAVDVSSIKVSSTSYATTQGTGSTPTPPPTATPAPSGELVTNPGFESSLTGWHAGNSRTTLGRACTVAHTGSCSAQIGRRYTTGSAVLDDSPNTVSSAPAGATYAASAWVKAPSGRTITFRLREYAGSSVVNSWTASASGTGAWQRLSRGTGAVGSGHSVSIDVTVSLTTKLKAQIDDVSLVRL